MNRNLMFENGTAIATLSEILLPYCQTGEWSVAESPMFIYGLAGGIPRQLEEVMLAEKFFILPDCTLQTLCNRMRTNRTYISTAIHVLFGMKFRNMVSALRIEFAKSMLVEHREMPIEDIALACGFQYSTQFDRKFHELTDMTPCEWRNGLI